MKRLSIVAMAILAISLVACNQASAGGSFGSQAKLDNLEKDFNTLKEEFEVIKYALDKRGISLEQARAEMEADNKVWDIPDEDSPVFGNTKNPKLTIVEFTEFQCPYCSRIAPTMKELNEKYPDSCQCDRIRGSADIHERKRRRAQGVPGRPGGLRRRTG